MQATLLCLRYTIYLIMYFHKKRAFRELVLTLCGNCLQSLSGKDKSPLVGKELSTFNNEGSEQSVHVQSGQIHCR